MSTTTLSTWVKRLRVESGLKLSELSRATGIDVAILSKIESNKRLPTDEQVRLLADFYQADHSELQKLMIAEKILRVIEDYPTLAKDSMLLAETRMEYLASVRSTALQSVDKTVREKLERIDSLKSQWLSIKDINGIRGQKLREHFDIHYTYESNRIEGNTLTLSETMLVIKEGITIAGKSVDEHLEAINHGDAIHFIYSVIEGQFTFDKRTVLQIHQLILRGINTAYAGKYRNVNVRITGAQHIPPEPYMIDKLMEDYFLYYAYHRSSLHPVLLAAEMHERLVSIHPFIDGNGRTSRLVMNLFLLQNGYTIVNLKGDQDCRLKYFKALEKVQIDNDPNAFYNLICDRLIDSLEEHILLAK